MQSKLAEVQERLKQQTFVGEAGGGLVKVTVNGEFEVVGIVVDVEEVGDDLELTVDLIAAAVNTAIRTAKEAIAEATRSVTGGLSLPGLL
jgi:DNA-binding YbaB/EbfC family protein